MSTTTTTRTQAHRLQVATVLHRFIEDQVRYRYCPCDLLGRV
jgi:hypothetical protein